MGESWRRRGLEREESRLRFEGEEGGEFGGERVKLGTSISDGLNDSNEG